MKTTIVLKRKSATQQLAENIKDIFFRLYCLLHSVINHPRQIKKMYWSVSDCYIEIGKSGYISNNKIYDLNGDITQIHEFVVSGNLQVTFSEPEISKIKKIAEQKQISIKDLLLNAVDRLKITE